MVDMLLDIASRFQATEEGMVKMRAEIPATHTQSIFHNAGKSDMLTEDMTELGTSPTSPPRTGYI